MRLLAKIGLYTSLAAIGATALYAAPAVGGGSMAELGRAQTIRDEANADIRHTYHLQALARKEKDVIKLNCVNDKLVLMKPQLNIIEQAHTEVAAGVNGGAAFTGMVQAGESVRHLREQADQCVGEGGLGGTESANGWTGPIVPDDPYTNPWGSVVEPPAYASPFT